MSKNLKNLTMAFAVASAPAESAAVTGKVGKPVATRNTDSPRIAKTVKAPKAVKAKTDRDPNSLLTNNFRLFAVVGTTTFKGSSKIWFANETATKVKNMVKQGHTNIEFVSLPQPMTKSAALEYLAANPTLLPVDQSLAAELVIQKTEKLTAALKRQAHTQNSDVQ